jgi:hypothetical protein
MAWPLAMGGPAGYRCISRCGSATEAGQGSTARLANHRIHGYVFWRGACRTPGEAPAASLGGRQAYSRVRLPLAYTTPTLPSSVHVSRALHLARTLQTAISALDQEATAHPAACPAPASAAAPIPRQSAQHGPQTIVRGYAIVEPPWSEADQPSCREQKPVCEC